MNRFILAVLFVVMCVGTAFAAAEVWVNNTNYGKFETIKFLRTGATGTADGKDITVAF
jgi:hypothetical protein